MAYLQEMLRGLGKLCSQYNCTIKHIRPKKVTVILTGKSGSASHKEQFPPMTIEITVLYCQIKNKQIEHNSLDRCVLIQYIQRRKLLLLRLNECSQENQGDTYNTRSRNKSIHRNINDLESETHYLFELQLVATT